MHCILSYGRSLKSKFLVAFQENKSLMKAYTSSYFFKKFGTKYIGTLSCFPPLCQPYFFHSQDKWVSLDIFRSFSHRYIQNGFTFKMFNTINMVPVIYASDINSLD